MLIDPNAGLRPRETISHPEPETDVPGAARGEQLLGAVENDGKGLPLLADGNESQSQLADVVVGNADKLIEPALKPVVRRLHAG